MLDGEQRASLAVTRSLVRAGHRVHVAARSRWALAALSRRAVPVRISADPLRSPAAFAAEVGAAAARLGCRLVIPVTDASTQAVLEHVTALPPGVTVPGPSLHAYREASDKLAVHRLAATVGLGIDETRSIASPADPIPDAADAYPAVVKPHRSVVGDDARSKVGVSIVRDREACVAALSRLGPEAFPVLLQRRVVGDGIGYFALRWQGRIVARFAHRRRREKPPAGGVSVLSESIAVPPALMDACDRLLERLDWQGVAMVECKEDRERGGWKVMEINGRFWGSLQLAIDAGVDFPALLVAAARGDALPPSPPAWRVGARLRWEWGDVDHLLIRLRRSATQLALPPGAPSRLGAIGAFLRHRPGRDRCEVMRLTDPLPFVGETLGRLGLGE